MEPTLTDIDAELLMGPTVVLATNGPDGRPQVSPVWFLVEDGSLRITIADTTQKARNLRRDDRCTVLAFHPASDAYYAEIRGNAEIADDHDYRFADRLGAKYRSDLRTFDGPQDRRLAVTIVPSRINVIDLR